MGSDTPYHDARLEPAPLDPVIPEQTAAAGSSEHALADPDSEDSLDSEDDYVTSEDEVLTLVLSSDERHHFAFGSTAAQNTEYFVKALSDAMESLEMDNSLAAQAQLSGYLNNQNQKLVEKRLQLVEKLANIRRLHKMHIENNRIGVLESDLKDLSNRINRLKHGAPKSLLFKNNGTIGVAEKYPIEYNKAKDKVLERVSDP